MTNQNMATYTDLNLSLKRHPGTGDIFKSYDVDAVKNALRNIILSNTYDKPFNPAFALNLRGVLFEQQTPQLHSMLERQIINVISQYEPRCAIDDLKITSGTTSNWNNDEHSLYIDLSFHVVGIPEQQILNITVERTR